MDKENEIAAEDDSILDKELEDSLNAMKAEEPKVATTQETKVESGDKPVDTEGAPTSQEPKEGEVPRGSDNKPETGELVFKAPTKGENESDASFNKRVELAELVRQRKLARSEDEKNSLSKDISSVRKELSTLNNPINNPLTKAETPNNEVEPEPSDDLKRLKELGGVTKDELINALEEREFNKNVETTVKSFVDKNPQMADEDVREVFFNFVESNYNWQGKSGQELNTVLELAKDAMFKPSETIQERFIKGANVQEKVNSMQFPGGSVSKQGISKDKQQSVDELMSTPGMTEEKALELLSDDED